MHEALATTLFGIEQCNDEKWLSKNPIYFGNRPDMTWESISKVIRRELRRYAEQRGVKLNGLRINKYTITMEVSGGNLHLFTDPKLHPKAMQDTLAAINRRSVELRSAGIDFIKHYTRILNGIPTIPEKLSFRLRNLVSFGNLKMRIIRGNTYVSSGKMVIDFIADIKDQFTKELFAYWDGILPELKALIEDKDERFKNVKVTDISNDEFIRIYFGGAVSVDNT